ncbi:MAG: hypothetical protein J6Y54_01690 [Lentisphaeria bacterium]|nr:hypothetical protein [Lentisphaeria bacterium]
MFNEADIEKMFIDRASQNGWRYVPGGRGIFCNNSLELRMFAVIAERMPRGNSTKKSV